jgi:hypothetical protein
MLGGAALLMAALAMPEVSAGPRSPKRDPRIVLASPQRGEYTVEANDLTFAFFKQTYFHKPAPRSQEPTGGRIEVEHRRLECRCLRFGDWSKIKFKTLRQIELIYTPGERQVRLRTTRRKGQVREFPASTLVGGDGAFPPRFGATVEGEYREFPLLLSDNHPDGWPDETLMRILIAHDPPRRRSRRH